jgi:HEAT repeats
VGVQLRSLPSRLLGAALVIFAMTATATDSVALDRELTEAADFRLRVQAALRLAKIGGATSRADLEKGLRDAHPAVRVACAVGLGSIGDASSVPAVEAAMRSETMASAKTAMQGVVDKLRSAPKADGTVENAKYVVQLGSMRNNSGVRPGSDLDGVMQQAARSKARSIKDAFVVDGADAASLKRATDRRIPVLLLDASLTKLTQSTGKDGGVIVTARVDLSIRRVPQQTLKGTVSGNASASDDARASQKAITELQNRAVHSAVQSAVSSVGSEIATLAKWVQVR